MKSSPVDLTLALLVRALPQSSRDRYRREFLGEVHGLSHRQQMRYLFGLAFTLWPLRRAITDRRRVHLSPVVFRSSLACKLRLGHDWQTDYTEDGHRYRRCHRCGIDHPSGTHGPPDGLSYAMVQRLQ